MKKFLLALATATIAVSPILAQDESLYLRGTFNNWEALPEWKLTPIQGFTDLYMGCFQIPSNLESFELKVGGSDWDQYDFGVYSIYDQVYSLPIGTNVGCELRYKGDNLKINNWQGGFMNVKFSLSSGYIGFLITEQPLYTNGEKIFHDPMNDVHLYLRGDFNNWEAQPDYELIQDEYFSYIYKGSYPSYKTKLKIADDYWGFYNFGGFLEENIFEYLYSVEKRDLNYGGLDFDFTMRGNYINVVFNSYQNTASFSYTTDPQYEQPGKPFTPDIPEIPYGVKLYFKGTFNNWKADPKYELIQNPEKPYIFTGSYHINRTNLVQFKIADENYEKYDFGTDNYKFNRTLEGERGNYYTIPLYSSKENIKVYDWYSNYMNVVLDLALNTVEIFSTSEPIFEMPEINEPTPDPEPDPTPKPEDPKNLYFRSSFNDWEANVDSKLKQSAFDPDIYYISVDMYYKPQNFQFKLADESWGEYNFGSNQHDINIVLSNTKPQEYTLINGNSDNIDVNNFPYAYFNIMMNVSTGKLTVSGSEQPLYGVTDYDPGEPDYPYLPLYFMNSHINGNLSDYILKQDPDNLYSFSGTFYIPEGAFDFIIQDENFKFKYGLLDKYNRISLYSDVAFINHTLRENGSFVIVDNWQGGTLSVYIDVAQELIIIETPDQPAEPKPDLYLRGTMNNWGYGDSWKLQQDSDNADIYKGTFQIESEYFEFKLADSDWNKYNYGTNEDQILQLYSDKDYTSTMVYNGGNIKVDNWIPGGTLKITFDMSTLEITLLSPEQPTYDNGDNEGSEDEDNVDLYLRGTMNDWGCGDSWKLQQDSDNPDIYKGSFKIDYGYFEFKLADQDWNKYKYGLNEDAILQLYSDKDYISTLVYDGNNIKIDNWNPSGTLEITFDISTLEMTLISPDQPTYDNGDDDGDNEGSEGIESFYMDSNQLSYDKATGSIKSPSFTIFYVLNINGDLIKIEEGESINIKNLTKGIYVVKANGYKPIKMVR